MVWTKIPKEHHPIFYAAFPDDARASTIVMFGGVAGMVGGHMFGGLWSKSVVVRLSSKDQAKVLAMKGSDLFDPMGRGKPMKDMVVLPAGVLKKKAELRRWLGKALEYTATLPPKKKKAAKKKAAKKKATKKKAAGKRSKREQ